MKILQAGVEHVAVVAPLFDAYRQFYKLYLSLGYQIDEEFDHLELALQ